MALSSLKKLIGIEEIDDDELTEDDIQEAREKLSKETKVVSNTQSSVSSAIPPIAGFEGPSSFTAKSERGTSVPEKRFSVANTSTFKMVLIEPQGFDECPKLVDNLKARKPVIINLEKLETEVARKIFDFLSGAIYAINGDVQKIANNIFIFTPDNVNIHAQQEVKQEKENDNPWRA